MIIKDEIKKNQRDFALLCKNHNVKYLYAFGSSVTDNFDFNTSDIDLLVELDLRDPVDRGEKLISLWELFEVFFMRKVDLLTETSIHNPFLRKSIDDTKVLLYDGSGQKIFS